MSVNNVADVASIFVAALAAVIAIVGWVMAARKASTIEHRHLVEVISLKEKVIHLESQRNIEADIREIRADIEWMKKLLETRGEDTKG